MPQMKPMNWIMLFLIMNLILMFINIMNFYFIELKHMNIINKNNNFKKKNWKW